MSDIFISYAREDRDHVQRLATSLERIGWSVWWDHRLQPGDPFDGVIEREIAVARIALVLWSTHSVNSVWVKSEAMIAQHQNKLVPILIEAAQIPMPFGAYHTANLTNWNGAETDPNLLDLLGSLLDRDARPDSDPKSSDNQDDINWHATLLAKEPAMRRFLLTSGTRRHELECRFRPNYLWNRFVLVVDGLEEAKGGHQYRDVMSLDFSIGMDWVGSVQLASGSTISSGSCIGGCLVSIGGRVLYRESDKAE